MFKEKLLNKKYRSYSNKYWNSRKVAPSALIFYLGFSEKIENLEHHNLFFDESFDNHLDDIFIKKIWPREPLFYVCCPSKTDKTVVPKDNYENIFILVPIGSGSNDNPQIREKYFKKIINRIENKTGQIIKDKFYLKNHSVSMTSNKDIMRLMVMHMVLLTRFYKPQFSNPK